MSARRRDRTRGGSRWTGRDGTRGNARRSTHGAHDLDADRDQRLPEPGHLRARERGAVGAELQFLEEDIRGRGERDAELIGPKRVQLVRPKARA